MSEVINILVIGDIVGRAGRLALKDHLPRLIDHHAIDFVVANGENIAAGFGMTEKTVDEILHLGVDVLTNGNHCWDKREIIPRMEEDDRLIRPLNFASDAPGQGWTIQQTAAGHKVAVINLIGQVFMGPWDSPFAAVERAFEEIPEDVAAILVDMHGEASSEKVGMGWLLDGRASFVFGTHTHIPTCDETILPGGTAYQTDVGMTGPYQSIIGMQVEGALYRMIQKMPRRFEPVERGGSIFATLVKVRTDNRKAQSIERIHIPPNGK